MKQWRSVLACFLLAGGMMLLITRPAYAGRWSQAGNNRYDSDGDGTMTTGWVQDGNHWYFMRGDGTMAIGWVQDGDRWYFMNGDGTMATGWVQDGNHWYFMRGDGAMATGWIKDGEKDYYLSASGAMLSNTTTPDGYFVGESGEWIPSSEATSGADTTNLAVSAGSYSVNHVDADCAIEADVSVSGSGGSVAKLVIFGSTAAMSFDLVTDSTAQGTYFYRENIHSNAVGGQDYSRVDQYPKAELGKTYHLMIAFRRDGQGTVYLNGELLDTFWNPEMTKFPHFDPAVEAGAMVNGSTVQAVFSNITVKKGDRISSTGWHTKNMDNNPGIHSDVSQFPSHGVIRIGGILQLRHGENWDTAYDGTSGKVYFQ